MGASRPAWAARRLRWIVEDDPVTVRGAYFFPSNPSEGKLELHPVLPVGVAPEPSKAGAERRCERRQVSHGEGRQAPEARSVADLAPVGHELQIVPSPGICRRDPRLRELVMHHSPVRIDLGIAEGDLPDARED